MRPESCLFILSLFLCHPGQTQIPDSGPPDPDSGLTSGQFQSLTFNGAWCWFSDPRAVYHAGKHKRTYTGWVDNYGDIQVGYYDHVTGEILSTVIYDGLEIDDHDNPSLLFDESGRLLVFFNAHEKGVQPLFLVKATEPESIDNWLPLQELHLNDPAMKTMGSMNHTYTNPVRLAAEQNRIYLFWRGIDGKPCYSVSDDNGANWSVGKILFMPDRTYAFRRPYTKIWSDGKDRIHFVFTDGHPRNEPTNSLYYISYFKGAFYRADGSRIKSVEEGPVFPAEASLVYDANDGKAWNWDISVDENGHPQIAYVRFPTDSTHVYCVARWDGTHWMNKTLTTSKGWFPESVPGYNEPEPNYAGGMSIDHESPNTVYLSVRREGSFEIEKWTTPDHGNTWNGEYLTRASDLNNVRPFAVRDAQPGNPVQVLWMQNTRYHHYAYGPSIKHRGLDFDDRLHASIKMDQPYPTDPDLLKKKGIQGIMRQTADWQLAHPYRGIDRLDWHYGAFYTGVRALYEVTGEDRYLNELVNIGQAAGWKPMDDFFNADRLTVTDTWCWLYERFKDPVMIDKSKWAMDIHLARNYRKMTDVRFTGNPYLLEWWTWCDALFMAPPSFVRMWKVTREEKYLAYMNEQWWKTSDYLYAKEDSLYYRDDRYFDRRTDNGKKVFWARGNGWVIAGLARLLSLLPADYPNRPAFEQQYREMAHKLLSIQDGDGLWRVSLLDPAYLDIGESSGSSFFTFALAWGLNNGLLDMRYRPQVEKAWTALCGNVNEEGRLGYVQQVAGDPYPFYADQWQVYATGAFLLAGKEMTLLVESGQ